MNISITSITPATPAEWDLIWTDCNYSTYFHSREWAEIWSVYTNGRICPNPIVIKFSDGKKALLPLSIQKRFKGLIRNYISSPAGTFGGWVSADDLSVEHAALLTKYLLNKTGNLFWRLNPYDKLVFQVYKDANRDDATTMINLSAGFDSICKGWTRGHASAARKARKEGVNIKLASNQYDWQSYFKAYEDSLYRWGENATSKYGWELFHEIFRRKSSHVKLWLAIYQNIVVAGALCFYAKKHVVYWHGAALSDYFYVRPVNLIMYEAIKDACEQGLTWFDFNPSGGHKGVMAFKKSFGAEELKAPVINIESKMSTLSNTIVNVLRKAK